MKYKKSDIIARIEEVVADAKEKNIKAFEKSLAHWEKEEQEFIEEVREFSRELDAKLSEPDLSGFELNGLVSNRPRKWFPGGNANKELRPEMTNVIEPRAIEKLEEVARGLTLSDGDDLSVTDLRQLGLLSVVGLSATSVSINGLKWFTGRR